MTYKDPNKQKEVVHQYYLDNKEKAIEATRVRRRKNREFVREIKETTACTDCGEYYPHYVMDFDHLDASIKINNIAVLVRNFGLKRLKEELLKCQVVCSNCHRHRTYIRRLLAEN